VIIPRPLRLSRVPGRFALPAALNLRAGHGAERPADLLAEYLAPRPRTTQGPEIHLDLVPPDDSRPPESYRLQIDPDQVRLTAPNESGLFHGVQTLRQLLAAEEGHAWPCLTIDDAPLLPWRGVMLDLARHFMPIEFLHDFVDQLALHKLNVLHLHLTDDQGWRIEIDGWPRLTEIGAWRSESMVGPAGSDQFDDVPHGGFYTQKQLGDLVRHAATRGVRIVPEIEMPGHARAALAAYPELGVHGQPLDVWTSWGISEDIFGVHDTALDFCREVLAQTVAVFPDQFVHIGGDECPTVQWETDPFSRGHAERLGLENPAQLHAWFLTTVRGYLAEHGRRAVSWDGPSAAPGRLPTDLVLAAWLDRADALRSIERGHQVLLTPHQSTFLDYAQRDHPEEPQAQPGFVITLADVYGFDPLAGAAGGRLPVADPAGSAAGVLGAQAQLWAEFLTSPDRVLYAAHPRLGAFAEAVWATGERDYAEFRERLAKLGPLLAGRPARIEV
jgi:hexosaminidase